MDRDLEASSEVREGLIRNQPDAVETVRGWAASVVYGARWGFSDPEALVQDVTVRLLDLARAGRIRDDTDFKSFVLTVARHKCTDLFRRERLRSSVEVEESAMDSRATPGRDPEQQLEQKERIHLVRFIFQALPEECQRLWGWVYSEGLSAAEVARHLGITEGNARIRVHRCLQKARKIRDGFIPRIPATVRSKP